MLVPFIKMHGCANDFVIIDNRNISFDFSIENIKLMADRHLGIGCDQLIIMAPDSQADCQMLIYNPDGSRSGACGNATRCVAWLIMQEQNKSQTLIKTTSLLDCHLAGDQQVVVKMGKPVMDERVVDIKGLPRPMAVDMGNPHLVFFVDDVDSVNLAQIGPEIEHLPSFPERVNVNIAQIISPSFIKLKVWERGAGLTMACGSGACATFAAASKLALVGDLAAISLPGGVLICSWQQGEVMMQGPIKQSFTGEIEIN